MAIRFGRQTNGARSLTIDSGSNNLMVVRGVDWVAPANGFVTQLGARVQRDSGNAAFRVVLYDLNPTTGLPQTLLAYTGVIAVGGTNEQDKEEGIQWSYLGLPRYPRVSQGQYLGMGLLVTSGVVNLDITGQPSGSTQRTFARKTVGGSTPPSPMNQTGALAEGSPSLWLQMEANNAPAASLVAPAVNDAIASTLPTFVVDFVDSDATYLGDAFTGFQIEARDFGTKQPLWGPGQGVSSGGGVTAGEAAAKRVTRQWDGLPLTSGRIVEWRATVRDAFDQLSAAATWRIFTVTDSGFVDVSGATPNGKEADGLIATWGGLVWHHPAGLAMTKAKIQLYVNETPVGIVSPEIVKSVTDGSTFSLSAAEVANFGVNAANAIAPGRYGYALQGRDAAGQWGDWGDIKAFSVNTPPSTPSGMVPDTTNKGYSAPPLVTFRLRDDDPDDVPGGNLVAHLEVTRPPGSVPLIVYVDNIATVDPVTGDFYVQLTTAQVPVGVNGPYKLRAIGRNVIENVFGSWSVQSGFNYNPNPAITLDNPTARTVPTATPIFQFHTALVNMAAFRFDFYIYGGDGVPFFSSGRVPVVPANLNAVWQMPGGWLSNHGNYYYTITAWSDLASDSTASTTPPIYLDVEFPNTVTAIGGAEFATISKAYDREDSSVLISWTRSEVGNGWLGYAIKYRDANPFFTFKDAVPIGFIRSQNVTQFRHEYAFPNRDLIYSVTQLQRVGQDVRESAPVESLVRLDVTTPTLTAIRNPLEFHAPVMYLGDGIGGGFTRPGSTYDSWGTNGKPVLITTPDGYGADTYQIEFTVISDSRALMIQQFQKMWSIVKQGGEVCLRTEDDRIFCAIDTRTAKWRRQGTGRVISVGVTEIYYDEAVRINV